MVPKELEAKELHDDPFLTILWDTPRRTIGIRWKPSAAKISDEDFRTGPTWRNGESKTSPPLRSRGRQALRVSLPARFRDSTHDEPVGGKREVCDTRLHKAGAGCRMAVRDVTRVAFNSLPPRDLSANVA